MQRLLLPRLSGAKAYLLLRDRAPEEVLVAIKRDIDAFDRREFFGRASIGLTPLLLEQATELPAGPARKKIEAPPGLD